MGVNNERQEEREKGEELNIRKEVQRQSSLPY